MIGATKELEAFELECWGQACAFRNYEVATFGPDSDIPHEYIRAFFGEVVFISKQDQETHVTTYPVLTVYCSGVITIELRILSPERSVPYEEFIDHYVRIHDKRYDQIFAPPSLATYASIASQYTYFGHSFLDRFQNVYKGRQHADTIKKLTDDINEGEFSYQVAPLASDGSEVFIGIAQAIVDVVGFFLSRRMNSLFYVLFGLKRDVIASNPWSSRPHIHILQYDEQSESSSKNAERHDGAIRSIFEGIVLDESEEKFSSAPINTRQFNDFLSYVGTHLSLRVWSSESVNNTGSHGRTVLVLEQQVVNNLLDYTYMLHIMLFRQASAPARNRKFAWGLQREVLVIEDQISACARAGELRALYTQTWEAFGLEDMRRRTLALLEVNNHEAEQRLSLRNELIGRILAILFGLSTLTPMVKKLVVKCMSVAGLGNGPMVQDLGEYLSWIVSFIVVLLLMAIVSFIIKRS